MTICSPPFARVAALQPDLVVVTGDFTTYHADVVEHAKRRSTPTFPRAGWRPWAPWAITTMATPGPTRSAAERSPPPSRAAGVRILRNELVDVEPASRSSAWTTCGRDCFQPGQALAPASLRGPMLALSHNPDTVDRPGWERFTGWILAGPHPRRAVQTPVPAAAYAAGAESALHRRGIRPGRCPPPLHQPRRGAYSPTALQRAPGSYGLRTPEGVDAVRKSDHKDTKARRSKRISGLIFVFFLCFSCLCVFCNAFGGFVVFAAVLEDARTTFDCIIVRRRPAHKLFRRTYEPVTHSYEPRLCSVSHRYRSLCRARGELGAVVDHDADGLRRHRLPLRPGGTGLLPISPEPNRVKSLTEITLALLLFADAVDPQARRGER